MDRSKQENYYTPEILENVSIGIGLLDAKDLHVITANSCFRELFVNSLAESQQAKELERVSLFSTPTFSYAQNLFRYVLETGKPYQGNEFPVLHPQRGITYWNEGINPIYDQDGQLSQFLVTASDVTAQVLARQQAETGQKSLHTARAEVDTKLQRLAVIETIARSVRKELDSRNIARAATEALVDAFNPICICIHLAESTSQELRLVHMYIDRNNQTTQILQEIAPELQRIPYDSPHWPARARNHREPIIIDNLDHTPIANDESETTTFQALSTNGYVCIPLWFKDHFEGTLIILFRETINIHDLVVHTLVDCSTYISAALAHSRLLTEIEYERGRLRSVLDHLPEGIFLVEAENGHISYANEAASNILNVPRETLLNLPLWETHTTRQYLYKPIVRNGEGQGLATERIPILRALEGKTVRGEEIQVMRPDSNKLTLLVSAAPIKNEAGVVASVVSIFQDISARKSVEEQKNDFLSIASHELRTPTTVIQGFAEILQMLAAQGQDLNSPSTRQAIDDIVEQSMRLTRLIDEMLDFSRIQHMLLALNKKPHDLVAIVKQAVEQMAITSRQHTIRMALQGLAESDRLIGEFDEERILQILNNLIGNALKYSNPGREIEVGLRSQETQSEKALLWVRDSGVGIPSRDLPHIFKRFHRAGNFDRSIGGLGIGLYLAHELVIQHGGSIWAESEEGVGSTFYVELPLRAPATEQATRDERDKWREGERLMLSPLVFLLDVDNTLLAFDDVKENLNQHLRLEIGDELTQRFWEIYEQVRQEQSVVDIPRSLQRLRAEMPLQRLDEKTYQHMCSLFENYPFFQNLYPHVLETLHHLRALGLTVILSDGDQYFQAEKTVEGRVLIYTHKQNHLEEILHQYPAEHYVMIDDKQQILADCKAILGSKLSTVFVRQGKYAQQAPPANFSPEICVEHIADLRNLTADQFLRV
jgi:PAS domain S-box-containing protein